MGILDLCSAADITSQIINDKHLKFLVTTSRTTSLQGGVIILASTCCRLRGLIIWR